MSTDEHMRGVVPIVIDGIVPADLAGQPGPDFDLVAPTELYIDALYQRSLSPKSVALIKRIVESWSWPKFKPPICAKVDGKLHVIDGQHTAIAAATHGGIAIIPVVVVAAPDVTGRAAAFVSHATNRLPTTPGQVWHAAVTAGDEDALTIRRVCERAGVTLLPYAPGAGAFEPGQTLALAAIKALIDRRGAMRARVVLEALAKADLAPISSTMIKVGEALLLDEDYSGEFDGERLTASIKTMGARANAEAKELAAAKCLPMWRALVATLFKNRSKRPSKPTPPDQSAPPSQASSPPTEVPAPIMRTDANRPSALLPTSISRTVSGGHVIDRRPPSQVVDLGDMPPPGRSALDQRRAAAREMH